VGVDVDGKAKVSEIVVVVDGGGAGGAARLYFRLTSFFICLHESFTFIGAAGADGAEDEVERDDPETGERSMAD